MTETMNPWLQFLTAQGGVVAEAGTGEIARFGQGHDASTLAAGYVAPLSELGIIAASGEDAAQFLHNQLTNDVEHLDGNEARLAGYCSPKGRLLATFLMWRTAEEILLALPREIQAPVQKRLQMFVLRSKVKLSDVSEGRVLLGIGGAGAAQALADLFPVLPSRPYGKTDSAAGTLIRLPDAFGHPRYQWCAPVAEAQSAWSRITSTLTPVGGTAFRLGDIQAGIPQIVRVTQEQFVPQMVNFEVVGGVNFKKGCYPGQEIVARSQYLGKLKRRMFLASTDSLTAVPGTEVFSSLDPGQPSGMIVNAEPNLLGGMDCLVELKTAATEEATLHLGNPAGPALRLGTLPYPIPA